MLDGFRKVDPPPTKQLLVEAEVLEYLVKLSLDPEACEFDCAIKDLTMIVCYYLLCIGEYTTKGTRNNSEQTKEFKFKDITFFAALSCMHLCRPDLRCLCRLRCHDHSFLATVIPPPATTPFYRQCQPLFSHSPLCQPLLDILVSSILPLSMGSNM